MKFGMVAGSLSCGVVCLVLAAVSAEEPADKPAEPHEYLLRYQFQPGDTFRWTVVNRCCIRTTMAAKSQAAQTTTASVKVCACTT